MTAGWWETAPKINVQLPGTYLGGHPALPEPIARAYLFLSNDGVHVTDPNRRDYITFHWFHVHGIAIEGSDQIQSRVTATRMLAVGLLAFAAKKNVKRAFVTLAVTDGSLLFQVEKFMPYELEARMQWLIGQIGPIEPTEPVGIPAVLMQPPSQVDPIEQIQRLAALRDQGIVSPEEFEVKKAELLGRM